MNLQRTFLPAMLVASMMTTACGSSSSSHPVPAPDPLPSVQITPESPDDPSPVNVKMAIRPAGEAVVLDAGADLSDSDDLSVMWRQVSGPNVTLRNREVLQPEVVPEEPGTYVFELALSIGQKLVSLVWVELPVVEPSLLTRAPRVVIEAPVAGLFGGRLAIRYVASDPMEDPALAVLYFSVDGGGTLKTATVSSRGQVADASSPGGARYWLVWNSAMDMAGKRAADVFIRVNVGTAADLVSMTHSPLFEQVSDTCDMAAESWPLEPSSRVGIEKALDQCHARLILEITALMHEQVAPNLGELDETLLLNLPLSIDAYLAASSASDPDFARVSALLDKALVAVAQLEALARTAAVKAEGPDVAVAIDEKSPNFQRLSNVLRVRHEMVHASSRILR